MEKGQLPNESRQLMVKESFKQGLNGILTACSKQDFSTAFQRFTKSEQDALHRVFVEVISRSHANILEEFESLWLETQAGDAFETVEQVLEEQSLDPLFADKTNVGDVWQDMANLKQKEIQHLKNVLQSETLHAHNPQSVIRVNQERMKLQTKKRSGLMIKLSEQK